MQKNASFSRRNDKLATTTGGSVDSGAIMVSELRQQQKGSPTNLIRVEILFVVAVFLAGEMQRFATFLANLPGIICKCGRTMMMMTVSTLSLSQPFRSPSVMNDVEAPKMTNGRALATI